MFQLVKEIGILNDLTHLLKPLDVGNKFLNLKYLELVFHP